MNAGKAIGSKTSLYRGREARDGVLDGKTDESISSIAVICCTIVDIEIDHLQDMPERICLDHGANATICALSQARSTNGMNPQSPSVL